jgi:ethanolamine utilization cobalamin adenosyltransferase
MNTREDEKWLGLLQRSTPTFAGEAEPPYGFVTNTLTRLRSENRQLEEIERIGWRALLASLAALVLAATVTLGMSHSDQGSDFEPGVRGFVQMENLQVS